MRANRFLLPALGLAASLAFSSTALAVDGTASCGLQKPGSLLLYPSFDSSPGTSTILTVTNTNGDVVNGTVKVEFVYIDGESCLEFNRTQTLTANDTLTVLAAVDNPDAAAGLPVRLREEPADGPRDHLELPDRQPDHDVDVVRRSSTSVNAISFKGRPATATTRTSTATRCAT